jgi:LPS O-antigen subunit length determinant protein (WzzB/FepE family)
LSDSLRKEVIRDAVENMHFFNEQLEKTHDPLLKEKIYALLAKEIEKETFARAQKYYGFLVLDPPIEPDVDKKVKPKRALICVLAVFVGFFVAVFLAFVIEFVRKIKRDDPARFAMIADEMRVFGGGRRRAEKVAAG